MSSFTKIIAPGVRMGYMLGSADVLAKIAKIAEDTYISPVYVAHGIAYEWCRRGHLPDQIETLKRLSPFLMLPFSTGPGFAVEK